MTHHKSVDLVRREERRRVVDLDAASEQASNEPDVAEAVWSIVRGERVRGVLQELPTSQREALVLSYLRGYTQREVARVTGVPLGTVKTRMLAGIRRLRERLQGQEEGA